MLIVPRYVRELSEASDFAPENQEHSRRALAECRDLSAWVLLGEPGAGKSEALRAEAARCDGVYLSVAEFRNLDLDEGWRGKTVFLDGLDETRADAGDESSLLSIRGRLGVLGNPPFRIACRAADWFGSTDREAIRRASPSGRLAVLLLDTLSDQDILDILRDNHGVADPAGFVAKAYRYGVDGLLQNPQTLGLLAHAIRGEQWPDSRQQVFELACKKLAQEENKRHRNRRRLHAQPADKILEAAGQLCAALLLSNKAGIALDKSVSEERFPELADFLPPDPDVALVALRTGLFRSAGSEELMVPSHRSIAEYLAARWLAEQVDSHGSPLGRVLNLLLGIDGRTVAGLRGLYAWFALCSRTARVGLIDADPMTVVIYGDVKPMQVTEKRRIFAAFRREAEGRSTFRWDSKADHPFGALADRGLVEDFREILESPERNATVQSMIECVLAVLSEGTPLPELTGSVERLISDATCWGEIRQNALDIRLKWGWPAVDALKALDALIEGRGEDCDDELIGSLLRHFYPSEIAPEVLLRYFHVPRNAELVGSYRWFWGYELSRIAPESHLPILLDQLVKRDDLMTPDVHQEFHLRRMIGAVLVKAISRYGEEVSVERLFDWLGVGVDQYGDIAREREDGSAIASWLENHPYIYKALVATCYSRSEGADDLRGVLFSLRQRLHDANEPEDMGLWYLDQASRTSCDALAKIQLEEAMGTLIRRQGATGLTLEHIEEWASIDPKRQEWLRSTLYMEIPDWSKRRAEKTGERRRILAVRLKDRLIHLRKHLDAIRDGKAPAALMRELAGVWMDHYSDTHGDTVGDRFKRYCEDGLLILDLAERGFRACVERDDLPNVDEIINLSIKQQEHFIRKPCLVGMELRWRDDPSAVQMLPDDVLRRVIAFRLTYGADNTPTWFSCLVEVKSELVAEVLVAYASVTLKARSDYVDSIYPLASDPKYEAVARLAVPALLERFPLRARAGQLVHLERLLKAGLRYALPQLRSLVEKKTATKSLDVAQKVYWLTCGMLLDPRMYESVLWHYVGNSVARANYVSAFLEERFGASEVSPSLSAFSVARLIELLAPHAEPDWPLGGGFVNEAMRRGDHVRALVTRLGALGSETAEHEITRLMALPALSKLKLTLENSRHQTRLIRRESAFRFLDLSGVVNILANREPASAVDLASLVLAHIDDIARDIRHDNSDLFRLFWTEARENAPKPENSCRDVLLDKLKVRLSAFGLDCQPEGDYFNDKRADIRIAYRNDFELPVEIKRENNDSLWTALRKQLIGQYAVAPKSEGHGIYLVLWFGQGGLPGSLDGGKKPTAPQELQRRLEALLNSEERKRISVRVLDVSWPTSKK